MPIRSSLKGPPQGGRRKRHVFLRDRMRKFEPLLRFLDWIWATLQFLKPSF